MVANPPASAEDVGSIPGWEDPLEQEMATHSSIPAWEISWRADPVDYSLWDHKRDGQENDETTAAAIFSSHISQGYLSSYKYHYAISKLKFSS